MSYSQHSIPPSGGQYWKVVLEDNCSLNLSEF